MHHPQPTNPRFEAQLRVQVPRDADGTLEDGVAARLRRIEAVSAVDDVELRGVVPRLNDVAVDATVEGRVRVQADDEDPQEAVLSALADGFGVAEVERCHLQQHAQSRGTTALEYG